MWPISNVPIYVILGLGDRIFRALGPKDRYYETKSALTDEEKSLFDQLQKDAPCVVCGSKGTHVIKKHIHKIVKEKKKGFFLWRKKTASFDNRTVAVPLCLKHYLKSVLREILRILTITAVMSWLLYKLVATSKHEGDIVIAIIFLVMIFYFFVLIFRLVAPYFLGFKCVWKTGPLKRLRELNWLDGKFKLSRGGKFLGPEPFSQGDPIDRDILDY